jgi:uncharacterized membrane protein
MKGWLAAAVTGTGVGCAMVAGVLFAFSTFVMPALARLPAAQGIAAMQAINAAAITRSFLIVFVGTAAACAAIAIATLANVHAPGAALRLIGAALYLAGTLALTRLVHIPRNDALATLDPAGVEAAARWLRYVASWTAWNHVRMLAALASAVALLVSARRP